LHRRRDALDCPDKPGNDGVEKIFGNDRAEFWHGNWIAALPLVARNDGEIKES